ncbi:hypothetical protein AB670_01330 [Chryseobacterium sp. MOF25P]|uniref:DUF3347 domain-containing protein n=1 Tax=unclassified Chryseobacterium TaxID=2593645 RepID=UPI0008059A62|nr:MULTISPECIES: DUF3347 domain-containing protein [unclassified Chryseobacterium]OBW42264.1 hypothetical protein AB670_01330 [Chryseobacterium sp. MOF25P]OBW46823.1 hypothetical protein AB671_01073 [Chryseobacterium sp. BGARF1]
MKNIIVIVIVGFVFSACSKPKTEPVENTESQSEIIKDSTKDNPESQASDSESSEVMAKTDEKMEAENTKAAFSTKAIIKDYLMLKNSLAKDDSKAAASAGKMLFETMKKTDINQLDAKKKTVYKEIAESMEENAEHIAAGTGSIEHQREHFDMLSKDVNDLIETFGSEQKLYKDFCPMYNDNKGAIWISEKKEIVNPYQGSKMLTCGSIQKEW